MFAKNQENAMFTMNTRYLIFWDKGNIWYNDYHQTLCELEFTKLSFKVDTKDLAS